MGHIETADGISRREFLKAGVGLAAVASGLELIAGCAATETPERSNNSGKGEDRTTKYILPKTDVLWVFIKNKIEGSRLGKQYPPPFIIIGMLLVQTQP